MFIQLPYKFLFKRYAVLSLLSLTSIILSSVSFWPASATLSPSPVVQTPAPFVRVLNIPVNDIVYDKVSKKIFASIPSTAGARGNSVMEIDPVTAEPGVGVFVGSEPNKLAISDGQTIYVGIDGAAAVRRVDVASHTATTQFRLGSDGGTGTFWTAGDLAVVPGNPNAVAIARIQPGLSPPGTGVAVYDNGVQRTNIA